VIARHAHDLNRSIGSACRTKEMFRIVKRVMTPRVAIEIAATDRWSATNNSRDGRRANLRVDVSVLGPEIAEPSASCQNSEWSSRAHMTNTAEPTATASARIDRGDVFWIGPDDSRAPVPSYSHPHVVVQDNVFNHSRITTVVVCALTSNLHRATEPGNVLLEPNEGNLLKQSVVVVSQVSSVDKARLGERIGSLSDARVEQILAGLRFQQASFFQR
jgi:mRNA interferase MazF